MANLFSIDNGKITYNKVSSNELNSITNKKKKLEELKNLYKNANQIVNNDIQKIGNYLNRNGQNVNKNNPFQANVVSNAMININKKNLNGRVTLQDVVQDHSNLLNSEKGQELKNNLRISKNERAWSEYNYNQEKVNNEETTLADKTIGTVTRGVKDLFSNMTDSRDIVDDKGKITRLPSYNELKQNKVSQDYKTGIGKFLGDASYNISKIGASTLMNIPTLGVGGSAIYWSDMYFDSYNSAKNQGYSEDKAFSYALANTGFEYIVGKFLGSATKGLTGGQTSELSNAISNGVNKLISNPKIASIIGNAGSEATEEFIQEYLDNINKLVTLNGSKNPKDYIDVLLSKDILKDAFYSAGVGAVSGGLLQGINNKEGKYAQYNTNLLKSFKNQLEISKSNLTDKETIAKYDSVINDINDYISKPFGNESKVEKTLPTVYDIVSQEKNSATVSNANIPRLTPETSSGTSSFNEETISPTSDALIATNRTSKTDGAFVPSIANNIAHSNESVNVPVNNKNTVTLSNEQQKQLNELDNRFKSLKSLAERNHPTDKKFRDKRIKGYAMEIADQKREVVQGEWLIPIEGGLTQIELNKKIERLKSNYIGKKVTVDGENATIFGNSYGKVGVEFEDGTRKYFEKSEINPIEDIDAIIKQQKTLIVQQKYQAERNQVPTEQTKDYISINQNIFENQTNEQIRETLNNTIDSIYKGIMPKGNQVLFTDVPQILNEIGVKDLPTLASPNTIRNSILTKEEAIALNYPTGKNENYHGLGKAGFNEVLNDLNEPVAIIKENPNKIIVLTEQFDYKNNQIIVPIEINTQTNYNTIRLDANVILSAHGRKSIGNYLNNLLEKNSKVVYKDTKKIQNLIDSRKVQYPESIGFVSDNNIPKINENVKSGISTTNDMQNNEINTNKVMNPNEISQLTSESANTTPKLPTKNVSTGKGESHFVNNIENKTNMLTKESKKLILSDDDVRYYQEVTNKASLNKAYERLNLGGKSETLNWFNKDSNKATDVDVAEGWILLKQYQDRIQNTTDLTTKDELNRSMVQVAKKMREMGTKAGQTVQAYNILNRLTPEGMVYYAQSELSEAFEIMSKNKTKEWIDVNKEKFNLTPQETEFIMKTMQEVQLMEDGYDKRVKLAEIQKLMTDKLPPTKGAGIKAWMRISMLFNPKTQVRNVMGNAIIAPVNVFGDLFASGADKLISKKTGIRTTGNLDIKSYAKGFRQGAYQSYNDFKKGINTRNIEGNRFEITEGKSFNDNNPIGKRLNKVDSLLSFMIDAGDRPFYEATFTNSINNQLVLNNKTEITQDMIDIATSEALSRTWQDNNGYTRFVLNVRKGLNAVSIGGYGLGDVLIPFAKTPANLTKAIIDYSPAGLVSTINSGINLKRSLSNGQYTAQMQHQFVQNLGKATAGTMLYVLGIALANAGITSGESDDDKDVANFMKNTLGINSYSIKIGNKSFTYDWAQPVAAPIAITANLVQKQKENANLYENIISSLDTAGNILLEQSFLESLNTVLSNNEGIATGIQEAVLELPSRAIPTFMKQIADLIDGTQRQTFEKDKPLETAVNKVKAKLPFVSKALAPSVDTMGREIQKYGGKNNLFNVFLNPANVNTENISASAKEIYRLYKSTGETNIMPRLAPYYINQDGEKIILNSKQREEYQKISGKIIENNIDKLLKSSEYEKMSDKSKAEVINDIVNYSYNIAKKEVLGIELSKTYDKVEQYSKIGNISDYYTFKASIDDTDKNTKKSSIANYLINSNLNNKQLAFLYGTYYSSEETLNSLVNANVPIKEFIKFNSQEFTTDYYNNGKEVPNSRKNKVIKYINSLNLSIPQKALLIKMEYSSYKKYDKQIAEYVNSMNISFLDKASILKKAGFTSYDKQIINYVNKMNITKTEKEEILEEMGFTIRNGRVYS